MNQKRNEGITLIALVITIIVLLILAGVTISMVLGDDGIIAQAQQANEVNEKGAERDEGAISSAEGALSRYNMGKYDSSKNNGIAKQNSTIDGEKASSENPVIPKGFKAVDVGDAVWSEGAVDKGLVIQDEAGNQFVWVPVNNTETFTTLTKGYKDGAEQTWVGTEPEILSSASYDGAEVNRKAILEEGYENTNEGLKKQFEDEYKAMVESVKAYGGFYVGRYETSWTGSKAASVATTEVSQIMTAATLLEANWITSRDTNEATWYGLYAKQKELYKKNSSSSVVSGMIYGCQWDAIMNWMLEDENTAGYVKDSSDKGNYSGSPANTGGTGYDIKNIYDLAGNYYEMTQEARNDKRVERGDGYDGDGYEWPVSNRTAYKPTSGDDASTSRIQLYIK